MTCSWKGAIFTAAFVLTSGMWTIARAQVVQPGLRMAQGWVVGVRPGNGLGMFRIRTGAGNNNLVAGVNRAGGGVMQQFIVGPATHFDAVGGAGRVPASFAALRPGQRVMVQAQGQQAIGVRILASNQGVRAFPSNPSVGAMRRGHYGHLHRAPSTSTGNLSPLGATTMSSTARSIGQPVAVNMNRNIRNVSATHAVHGSSHRR
jgi:hypothetical protein